MPCMVILLERMFETFQYLNRASFLKRQTSDHGCVYGDQSEYSYIISPVTRMYIFIFLMSRTCQMPAANAARDALPQT